MVPKYEIAALVGGMGIILISGVTAMVLDNNNFFLGIIPGIILMTLSLYWQKVRHNSD